MTKFIELPHDDSILLRDDEIYLPYVEGMEEPLGFFDNESDALRAQRDHYHKQATRYKGMTDLAAKFFAWE